MANERKNKKAIKGHENPGLLIVFEGLDGAGKSTQVKRLADYLREKGHQVVVTEWNSSKYISRATKRAKRAHILTPHTFSALHATDFFYRLENIIAPSLATGKIVIADRYSYTAISRGRARGIDTDWVSHIYSLAIEPDLAILADLDVNVALERVTKKNDNPPKYYEAGMDVSGEIDPIESFREFQTKVGEEYSRFVREGELTPVDMNRPEDEIFQDILQMVEPLLKDLPKSSESLPAPVTGFRKTGWVESETQFEKIGGDYISRLPEHGLPGKLVVIEGVHRAGVTHQLNVLYDWLQVRGVDVVKSGLGSTWITKEITDRALRKNALTPRTNVLLRASEISNILEVEVIPALRRGATVLLDRYLLSNLTQGLLRGINQSWMEAMLTGLGIRPDLTIFLDVSFETLFSRIDKAGIWSDESVHAGLDIGFTRDFETSFEFYQRRSVALHRKLAKANNLPVIDCGLPVEGNYLQIAKMVSDVIGLNEQAFKYDEELQEVLDLYHAHNGYFEHAQKVRKFALQIFDETYDIHRLGKRPRRLLEYAALLHDVGHSLGANHEMHSYNIIMNNRFSRLNGKEQRIVAIASLYHNGQANQLDEERQSNLHAEEQLAVRRLAGILRIADALDRSNNQVVEQLRLVREHGAIILDINSVSSAKAERKAVLAKRDLFEKYFKLPVLVDVNRAERIIRKGTNTDIDLYS